MGALITFASSAVLMLAFLGWRAWETARGARVAHEFRSRIDDRVLGVERFFRHEIPLIAAYFTRLATAATMRAALRSLHGTFFFLSKKMHRFLEYIEGRGNLTKKGSASFFLRAVSEHKKGLEKPEISSNL